MNGNGKAPTGEEILSLLARLYADQMGVNIKYVIESGGKEHEYQTNVCGVRQAHQR